MFLFELCNFVDTSDVPNGNDFMVEETDQQIKVEEMGEAGVGVKADKAEQLTGRWAPEEHCLFLCGQELVASRQFSRKSVSGLLHKARPCDAVNTKKSQHA